MLRRLSHHVAWSRKGRRPAQAAQALAASSVRQGPVRGRTWTPHGAVQSQTSSRTTRRQGTEAASQRQVLSQNICPQLFTQNLHLSPHRKHAGTKHTNTERDSKWEWGAVCRRADQPAQGTTTLLSAELLPQKREDKGAIQMARSSRRRSLVQTRRGTRAETTEAPGNYKNCQWES